MSPAGFPPSSDTRPGSSGTPQPAGFAPAAPRTILLGLADPRAALFGAQLDGVTDDTEAFRRLHEAINLGVIPGYYVSAPTVITAVLPTIKTGCEIVCLAGGMFDLSQQFGNLPAGWSIEISGSVSAGSLLTENAATYSYILGVSQHVPDGTILKLVDPTTVWDPAGTGSHPGEQVEAGRPDGQLVEGGAFIEAKATNGSEILTEVSSFIGVAVGQRVTLQGSGGGLAVAEGTTIVEVNEGAKEIRMSAKANAKAIAGKAKVLCGNIVGGPSLKPGQVLGAIWMTTLNPRPLEVTVIEQTGNLELGSDVIPYTNRTLAIESFGNFVIFTLGEYTVLHEYNQGFQMFVANPEGKQYLRTPVTHEQEYTTANKCTAAVVTPARFVNVRGLRVKGPMWKEGIAALKINYAWQVTVTDLRSENCLSVGLQLADVWFGEVINPWIFNSRELNMTPLGGRGYGVSLGQSCQNIRIIGLRSARMRHAVTAGASLEGGIPRRVVVIGAVTESNFADAYDTHGSCNDIKFISCIASEPNGSGFNMNAPKAQLIGCETIRAKTAAQLVNQGGGATDYLIANHTGVGCPGGFLLGSAASTVGSNCRRLSVSGWLDGITTGPAVQIAGFNGVYNQRRILVDVDVNGPSGAGPAVLVSDCANYEIRLRADGINKAANGVTATRCNHGVIRLGTLEWAEAGGAGSGVVLKECEDVTVYEGTYVNLGGSSTKVESTCKRINIYQGRGTSVKVEAGATEVKQVVPA